MFRVSQRTDNGTKYLLDRNNEVAYFFTKASAEEMAYQISEGIPEIEKFMRVEQIPLWKTLLNQTISIRGLWGSRNTPPTLLWLDYI